MDTILSLLSTLIGSPVLGAAGGVLGSLFTSVMAHFKQRQVHKQEIELRRLDLEQIHLEGENAVRLKNMDMQQASMQWENNAYMATLQHDATGLETEGSLLLIIAEFCRRIFRPFITSVLLFACVAFFFSDLSTAEMRMDLINAMIGATVMALTWWFCDRSQSRKVGA